MANTKHNIDHTVSLLQEYLKGAIHPDTHSELRMLLEKYPELHVMVEQLDNAENLHQELSTYKAFAVDTDAREIRILTNIMGKIDTSSLKKQKSIKKLSLWYVAAACFVGLTIIGVWSIKRVTTSDIDVVKLAENFNPGSNKATLHFSDGTSLGLDQNHKGIVIGNDITYNDGSVALGSNTDKNHIMTLSTPRGGQYQIVLSDGTKVWLNADTRLSYPDKFTESQRLVELDGEAYFEVTKSPGRPFIVMTAKEKIEVLGTHFNVYSYPNELESKVSLQEGKVKVSVPTGKEKVLAPGQQAVVDGESLHVQQVAVEESISWTNDEFMFNNEPLGTVLKQVARWYDVDIEVDPSLAKMTLWGSVSRLDTFDKVLKIIKMTDDKIKIQIEGRRVRLMK
ncbi:FecR domain-containing protein [Sphingobacterium sp. KU25419]|nr:FecR domain-containing protein [Sphingobacterium sp. KU25419]